MTGWLYIVGFLVTLFGCTWWSISRNPDKPLNGEQRLGIFLSATCWGLLWVIAGIIGVGVAIAYLGMHLGSFSEWLVKLLVRRK